MPRFVALLRGINVGGHKPVPMAELRGLCESLGLRDVETYIQSGNVVFSAASASEARLEWAIAKRFGFPVDVIVRSAKEWPAKCPWPEREPNRVMLLLSKRPAAKGAVENLRERATGETIEAGPGGIWVHYPGGQAKTKLTPALLDRLVGSPVTARNWITVQRLGEMVRATGGGR